MVSPNERWLAVSSLGDGSADLHVIDAKTGQTAASITCGNVYLRAIAFSKDGKLIAASLGKQVLVWEIQKAALPADQVKNVPKKGPG